MATTDAKPGFRLPWTPEHRPTDDERAGADTTAAETEPAPDAVAEPAAMSEVALEVAPTRAPAAAPRAASKFRADLTRAMRAAAVAARDETMTRLEAEAKTHIEDVHARASSEAAGLRRRADDDVAAIREWSKAEIARIRDETETRITDRKGRLETETDEHTRRTAARVERVQARIAAFDAEMSAFFERLLAEEDPTALATMAESLPEPAPFDAALDEAEPEVAPSADRSAPPEEAPLGEDTPAADDTPVAETAAAAAATDNADASTDDAEAARTTDPRLAALGLTADFAAAEAEAFASVEADADTEIPVIADEERAARLTALLPAAQAAGRSSNGGAVSTRVVVVGLVSVASIAGFKRQLARLPGIQLVGVSSGPESEFIFAVTHTADAALRDAIPGLPGFDARITGEDEGVLHVSARDPESEA